MRVWQEEKEDSLVGRRLGVYLDLDLIRRLELFWVLLVEAIE